MATVKKNPKADLIDSKLRAQGFVTVKEVSDRLGKDISTVYRWIEEGEIEGEDVMGRRYILLRSVVTKIGTRASVLLGLITDEQAKKIASK